MSDTIEQMLNNSKAESWGDLSDDYIFDDDTKEPLDRLNSYVDYCFDTYDVVSENLTRARIQTCTADWDRLRGKCKYNAKMDKRTFGKRVTDSSWRKHRNGRYAVFVAKALIGVEPDRDNGLGWKHTVRHELGHAIDYEQRQTSGHDEKFKKVMRQFGDGDEGKCVSGYMPKYFR